MPTDEQKIAAFDALTELGVDLLRDNATFFNCKEADAIAQFIAVAYGEPFAQDFLQVHAWGEQCSQHNEDGSPCKETIDKEIR